MNWKFCFLLVCLLQLCLLLASARSLWEPGVSNRQQTDAPAKRDQSYDERLQEERQKAREKFSYDYIKSAVYSNRKRDTQEEQGKLSIGRGGGFGGFFGGRGGSRGGGRGGSRGGGKGGRPKAQPKISPPRYTAVPRGYGGGRYYGGGATAPFTAGRFSPLGVAPFVFLPLAALAFFPGPWLHGGYLYHGAPYRVHNDTDENDKGRDVPVTCICQERSHCGCEKNSNKTYIDSVVKEKGPGGLPKNSTLVKVATVNGTQGIWINGTIPKKEDRKRSSGVQEHQLSHIRGSGYFLISALICYTALAI